MKTILQLLLLAASALFSICAADDGQASEHHHIVRAAQEASVEICMSDSPYIAVPYTSSGICVNVSNIDPNKITNVTIAQGLKCRFYFILSCEQGNYATSNVFGEGTFYEVALWFPPIKSLQCWPKQCKQPDPHLELTGPATLTCASTAPSASPPVGFDYSFEISLSGQTTSAAATGSTGPPSTFATSAFNTAGYSNPPQSPTSVPDLGSKYVGTYVPPVPTGTEVCLEINGCYITATV